MRHVTFLVAVLAVAPFSAVTAQEPPPVKVGDRVRVTAPNLGINKRTGVLQVVGDDTLVVDTMRLALASMTRLEVSRGWKRHTGKAVRYGLVLGFVAGGLLGEHTNEPPPPCEGKFCSTFDPDLPNTLDRVARTLIGAGIGAGIGAAAGALVGFAIKTEQWEEAPLDQLRVSFAPQRDGRFALGLSVRF